MNSTVKILLSSSGFSHFCFIFLFLFRNSTALVTDANEVKALNSIFQKWNTQPEPGAWNISGEPCSGTATDANARLDDHNPAIKCDCSLENSSTCHITHLKVFQLEITAEIPEELVALQFLINLEINQNYFYGPLPAFIGKLSRLEILRVSGNTLSGSLPKELGKLKQLTNLAIGSNNFSGTLPPELGFLDKLEEIFIDSNGVRGEIPSTFANLRNIKTMWAFDCPLTGKIPKFIGNWNKLTELRFGGNSLEGPIPSSFSNLTLLKKLQITDLNNVSSSLDFIKNMKKLTYLSLRSALINGSIPSYIGKYESLRTLDLSFNNLSGQIPSALFSIETLTQLYLGNNSLSGGLPQHKIGKLQTIDFSYNYLSGPFPEWVNNDVTLNLVGNNFTFDSSNISDFYGLNCLQRYFPCYRNAPRYSHIAINSGGKNFGKYEADDRDIGEASFVVPNSEKWAISNVGFLFTEGGQALSTLAQNTGTKVINSNTTPPDLYQTSRKSIGSLRYYGLGLENGPYNVSLFFAEIVYGDRDSRKWGSLGRRVFDIYIQGTRRWKDFDISKEAGGVRRAIRKSFNANVTENHLEIHLFWAGKGTCCIPGDGNYGPLISALSVTPEFRPTVGIERKNHIGLIAGIAVPLSILGFILMVLVFYTRMKGDNDDADHDDTEVLLGIGHKTKTFSYAELRSATEDFNPSNKLGEGGFGPVYKGVLSDGRIIAVKQLSLGSHQGKKQFINEIASITAVQHRNLVKLYGYCIEGTRRLLVYEYHENNSLDKVLFGNRKFHLNWPTRFKICLGTAKGLAYLHEESKPKIVHRDVKASNILLDIELCPKISDFGLAKLFDDKKTHINTDVAGTIGYLAPEYAMRGHLTNKADVFSFGVVALEIISGRANSHTNLDREKIYLLDWAWSLHESNQSLGLVDPTLIEFDENEALRVIAVGLLCTQASPMSRPPMSRVVNMLTGDIEIGAVTSKPSYLTDWNFNDETSSLIMHSDIGTS